MDTALKILSIAVGGAFGSVARYLINVSPLSRLVDKFPLPTFVVNIAGSFLIGFMLIVFTDRVEMSDNFKAAVMIGFIGAFTTFSTFELEIFELARERQILIAFGYLILSLVVGFAGLLAGVALGRRV
ncbi:MAG: fluoride efflux transporter CrcB [Pyrinomonadaceae bacterium]